MRQIARYTLLTLLCTVALVLLPACGGQQLLLQRVLAGLHVEPFESRIDVVHGRTLIIPIAIDGGPPPDVIPVRLDDRRTLDARLYWITAESEETPTAWLPPAGRWKAVAASEAMPTTAGWWVLVLDLPHDAINQGIWLTGRHVPLNWFLAPSRTAVGAGRGRMESAPSSAVLALAQPEMLSPVRRWRYRLLVEGLAAEDESGPAVSEFEDPVLEAIALQYESRWRVALSMLALADREVAERLGRRLVAVAEFPDGTLAPAWPVDEGDLELLLGELLNPKLDVDERAGRATAWLDSLAPAAVWVIDDCGLREADTGAPVSTVAVANLGARDVVASAAQAGAYMSPELRPVPTFAVRTLAPAALPAGLQAANSIRAAPSPKPVSFTVGRWSGVRVVVTDPLPVMPPGLRLEPLTTDWTLRGWLAGSPEPAMRPAPAWSTSVLLYYEASPDAGESSAAQERGRWMLHLECRAPPDNAGDDGVLVWLGPFGSPSAILRIGRDGGVTDALAARTGREAAVEGAVIARMGDRWIAQVPLAQRHIEHSGELLMGLARADSRGVRSAWPRPMLPWQVEPGRLTIDTTAWGEMTPPVSVGR